MMVKGFRAWRFTTLFVVLALLISLVPTPAYAATSKTVKNVSRMASFKTVKKKATKVKKGTTKLTFAKGQGWVKFKAPKKGTYTFTFSDLKSSQDSIPYGYVVVEKDIYGTYSTTTMVKTQGGKNYALYLTTKAGVEKAGEKANRRLAKRYGKLKLKKGETVYFYFLNSSMKKTSLKLNIK